jgi:hypothetical protein
MGVVDAHPALLGGVDEEQPSEGPVGLAAGRALRFLVDDEDATTGIRQFGGGDEAGESGADYDHVGGRRVWRESRHPELLRPGGVARPGSPS